MKDAVRSGEAEMKSPWKKSSLLSLQGDLGEDECLSVCVGAHVLFAVGI